MKRFANILYVHDSQLPSAEGLSRAAALAQNHQAELTVMVASELPRLGRLADVLPAGEFESRFRRQQQRFLDAAVTGLPAGLRVSTVVRIGRPFIEVIRDVLRNGRDLVVKPATGGEVDDFLFGSMEQHLLRKCPCPVWILPPGDGRACERVLAAVDFNPGHPEDPNGSLNRNILELAAAVAMAEFARLHVVHAWTPIAESVMRVFSSELSDEQVQANVERERSDHDDMLSALGQKLRTWIGSEAYDLLEPRMHLVQGAPRKAIPRCVSDLRADLLVMGTLSRTGVAGLIIGNTAEHIIDHTRVAVLAVKPEGFVSPVTLDADEEGGPGRG